VAIARQLRQCLGDLLSNIVSLPTIAPKIVRRKRRSKRVRLRLGRVVGRHTVHIWRLPLCWGRLRLIWLRRRNRCRMVVWSAFGASGDEHCWKKKEAEDNWFHSSLCTDEHYRISAYVTCNDVIRIVSSRASVISGIVVLIYGLGFVVPLSTFGFHGRNSITERERSDRCQRALIASFVGIGRFAPVL